MPSQANGLYEFGSFRLDAARRLLTRDGETVILAPKTLDVLLLLVDGDGRVLTKRELMNSLWPETFVEEASLSYQIAALRKALGEEGEKWIETVPKHGYRFTVAVTKLSGNGTGPKESVPQSEAAPAPARRLLRFVPWLVAAAATLVAALFATLYFREVRRGAPAERPVRFHISLPPTQVLGRAMPAVSPDGEMVAFGGIETDGKTRLWVRRLSSLSAEAVPGSEGAVSVFWSPDSRSLGFFSDGKLKRSDLNGSPPQVLCDASDSAKPVATWGRDGVILFNSEDRSGLFLVSANGGDARPVTFLDASRQETFHAWPQFLPDGRFLYLVQSSRPEIRGIYVGSLDSKTNKRVTNSAARPFYAESPTGLGYLLSMQGTTLMAQRFDAGKLELKGAGSPVAEGVWLPPAPAPGFGAFSLSANGVLAYTAFDQEDTELIWFDRQGKRLETVGEPGNYVVPALSPDDKKLAVARTDTHVGTKDLWLFEPERPTPSRFTFDPAEETNPTWSPDGHTIAFTTQKTGLLDIYQKPVMGGGIAEPLVQSNTRKIIQGWSPDGRYILYDAEGKLWAHPLDGGPKPLFLLALRGESRATLSPDMSWLAYQSNESGRTEVYVQSFPPTGAKWQVSTAGGEEPYWRRDGKELFYVAGKRLMAVDVISDKKVFHSGVPKPLFEVRLEVAARRSRYQVAANGQRFLVNVPLKSASPAPITVVTNWMAGLKQ